jgi:hypothetical protein
MTVVLRTIIARKEPTVLKRMIRPSPDRVRLMGLAAMVGGALGVLVSPFYSLAYFASSDGASDGEGNAAQQAWAEPARDFLEPLLTFASADVVRVTYGKLWLLVWMGMLAGLVALHARHAGKGGRLERWGFRTSFAGLLLLVTGAFGFWLEFALDFAAFLVFPGLLLVVLGSPIFGLGTWRAGVAPRIGALLLVVGGPALLVISEIATLGGGLVLVYLAWVVLGHALWSESAVVASRGPAVRTS